MRSLSEDLFLDHAVPCDWFESIRGGDPGRLPAGNFYDSTEGMSAPVKIRAPLCLSNHPQNPASPEEVLALTK